MVWVSWPKSHSWLPSIMLAETPHAAETEICYTYSRSLKDGFERLRGLAGVGG
jgi:hypothetical protein